MSEYIYEHKLSGCDAFGNPVSLPTLVKHEEIVRCRDCVHYYEAEEYHPQGNYDKRCCKYFDTYDNEVKPYGFCAWGERREQ